MDPQTSSVLPNLDSTPVPAPQVINNFGATCRFCSRAIPSDAPFCPYCGQQLKSAVTSISLGSQLWLYFGSFFFAPFLLGRTIRYIRSEDPKAKTAGYISLVLTLLALFLGAILMVKSFNQLNTVYNQINTGF